ncbi:hypothetical protein SteCoe_1630 [Stentor coeruleus]|uniref:Uncharacterized protein n=1 Tax=Stentor coeruleus TaxID=5963 RepID=A0A1R2D1K7_9CILI|nr:hypothetical protein SteCoe_1630 [Stentor coeruleus]
MNKYSDLSIRSKNSNSFKEFPMNFKEKLNFSSQFLEALSPDQGSLESSRILKSLSPGISPISYEKNLRVLDMFETPDNSKSARLKLPELSPKSPRFPTGNDFNALLEKIDKVIYTKPKLIHHTVLKQNESQRFSQRENEYAYYKVFCLKKRCPMQVKIKITKGNLITFVSLTNPQPTAGFCDRSYNFSYFEISDNGFSFKFDHVYMGIKALAETQYKIKITFAKIKSLAQLRKDRQATISESFEIPEDTPETTPKEKNSKNFIHENIHNILNSISKSPNHLSHIQNWENKKQEVNLRKKKYFIEKRDKALKRLNKKAVQDQEHKFNKLKIEKEEEHKKTVATWLVLLNLYRATTFLHKKWKDMRNGLLDHIKYNNKIRLIQKSYRRHTIQIDGIGHMIIASNSLLLFRRPLGCIMKLQAEKLLPSFISFSANRNFLALEFSLFIKKIRLIQKNTRKFLVLKKSRIQTLVSMWNNYMKEFTSLKRPSHAKKKENLRTSKSLNIARDSIIYDYYKARWRAFRDEVREIIKNFSPYWVVRKVLYGKIGPMEFNYIPSDISLLFGSDNLHKTR